MFIMIFLIFLLVFVLLLIGGIYTFKKNKKIFTLLLVVDICFFIFLGYHFYTIIQPVIFPDFTQTLKLNWKIDLPSPKDEKLIASNGGGLPGDSFLVLQYADNNDITKIDQIFEWSGKDNYIQDKIAYFMQHLNDGLNQSKLNTNLEEKIKSNSIVLNTNFKYYYQKKDDNSYIIFILSGNEKRIYIMQSMS